MVEELTWGKVNIHRFDCPDYVEVGLRYIATFFDDVRVSKSNPFMNTGWKWISPIFNVYAYDWCDDTIQPYNFYYKKTDVRISWYKYAGRVTTINKEISRSECGYMIRDCVEWLIENPLEGIY
jgi:hypothetical protein